MSTASVGRLALATRLGARAGSRVRSCVVPMCARWPANGDAITMVRPSASHTAERSLVRWWPMRSSAGMSASPSQRYGHPPCAPWPMDEGVTDPETPRRRVAGASAPGTSWPSSRLRLPERPRRHGSPAVPGGAGQGEAGDRGPGRRLGTLGTISRTPSPSRSRYRVRPRRRCSPPWGQAPGLPCSRAASSHPSPPSPPQPGAAPTRSAAAPPTPGPERAETPTPARGAALATFLRGSPAEVWATLIDEGASLASWRRCTGCCESAAMSHPPSLRGGPDKS